jgi:hypothetical protein
MLPLQRPACWRTQVPSFDLSGKEAALSTGRDARNHWIAKALRRALSAALVRLTPTPTPVLLPMQGLNLLIDCDPTDRHLCVIRAALIDDWKEQAKFFDATLNVNSLAVDEWTIDFGDGCPPSLGVLTRGAGLLAVTHRYQPGYYVVTATCKVAGQDRALFEIPQVGLVGEGEDPVCFWYRGAATVLVAE